jgi:hypothetical protein
MRPAIAVLLLLLALIAAWQAAPARGAAEQNIEDYRQCRREALLSGIPRDCSLTTQRETWRTDALLIAAVFASAGALGLIIAIPPPRRAAPRRSDEAAGDTTAPGDDRALREAQRRHSRRHG